MCFFQSGLLFSIESAKFWLVLACFGYFVANICSTTTHTHTYIMRGIEGAIQLGRIRLFLTIFWRELWVSLFWKGLRDWKWKVNQLHFACLPTRVWRRWRGWRVGEGDGGESGKSFESGKQEGHFCKICNMGHPGTSKFQNCQFDEICQLCFLFISRQYIWIEKCEGKPYCT